MKTISLAELATQLGAELQGSGDHQISEVATLRSAKSHQIGFLANKKYRKQLETTEAGAVLLSPADAKSYSGNALIMKNPYLGFAKVAQLLDHTPVPAPGIHPSAVIHESATIGANVSIGAHVVIEANCHIGDGCMIEAGCTLAEHVVLGAQVHLKPKVTVYHRVVMGARVVVHANTVIGSDGFGYANDAGNWVKIPQLGGVEIGDGTEIGASTTIDRGAIEPTIIGRGCIIDNQVQIGHNCVIGDHTAIAGTTGIAGSTEIGKYCVVGGGVGINGHIRICDGAQITGYSMVVKDIESPGIYSSGIPATANREWRRGVTRYQQLGDLFNRVKALEATLNKTESE